MAHKVTQCIPNLVNISHCIVLLSHRTHRHHSFNYEHAFLFKKANNLQLKKTKTKEYKGRGKEPKDSLHALYKSVKEEQEKQKSITENAVLLVHLLYIYAPPTVHAFLTRHVSGKT